MKKPIACIVFCLAMSVCAFAQSKFPELEKVKKIKLLESTREDVKKIFGEYADEETKTDAEDSEDEDEYVDEDQFSTKSAQISFRYTHGECSDDNNSDWNVAKGLVTEINIALEKSIKAKDLNVDLSKLQRFYVWIYDEEDGDEDPDYFAYYDKTTGISYGLSDGEIKNIKIIPLEKNFTALCTKFISNEYWLRDRLRSRPHFYTGEKRFANITEIALSKTELTADCPNAAAEEKTAPDYFIIAVATKGESNDSTDYLTYNYTVSGGKIVGKGANVTWDLSGIKSGKYTITAGADNGCGVCGTTKTETIVVKEFADCKQK